MTWPNHLNLFLFITSWISISLMISFLTLPLPYWWLPRSSQKISRFHSFILFIMLSYYDLIPTIRQKASASVSTINYRSSVLGLFLMTVCKEKSALVCNRPHLPHIHSFICHIVRYLENHRLDNNNINYAKPKLLFFISHLSLCNTSPAPPVIMT